MVNLFDMTMQNRQSLRHCLIKNVHNHVLNLPLTLLNIMDISLSYINHTLISSIAEKNLVFKKTF